MIPPSAGGIQICVHVVSVDGGIRMELQTDSSRSIDFSQSLDNRLVDSIWTGESVSVAVAPADLALANQRLVAEWDMV